MRRWVALLLFPLSIAQAADARVTVAAFSRDDLDGWVEKRFAGRTDYRLVDDNGKRVLKAQARAAASGLYKRLPIDLEKTPFLHWSWKVTNVLGPVVETTKAGDDYPARVYVVFSGRFFWQTRALNYVWSSNQPEGSMWPNAFTSNARMISVRSGAAHLGQWLTERRDVRADYRRAFGEDVVRADAVAIMTDTDNSGGTASAFYGDIYFSGQ